MPTTSLPYSVTKSVPVGYGHRLDSRIDGQWSGGRLRRFRFPLSLAAALLQPSELFVPAVDSTWKNADDLFVNRRGTGRRRLPAVRRLFCRPRTDPRPQQPARWLLASCRFSSTLRNNTTDPPTTSTSTSLISVWWGSDFLKKGGS